MPCRCGRRCPGTQCVGAEQKHVIRVFDVVADLAVTAEHGQGSSRRGALAGHEKDLSEPALPTRPDSTSVTEPVSSPLIMAMFDPASLIFPASPASSASSQVMSLKEEPSLSFGFLTREGL